jgi:hypothetical protein
MSRRHNRKRRKSRNNRSKRAFRARPSVTEVFAEPAYGFGRRHTVADYAPPINTASTAKPPQETTADFMRWDDK